MDNKQYGVYTGFLKEESIKIAQEGEERDLFSLIDGIGYFIWRMNHDAAHGRFEMTEGIEEDLKEAQYAIEYAVLNTRRFGVEIPDVEENGHVERTDSYDKWFRWWNDYFKYKLTDDEWNEYQRASENKEDLSKYRPEGDWKNT